MVNEKVIVLVSGGMDSLVTSAIANVEHKMFFLHLNYGQRTEERELKAFNDIADFYKIDNRLIVNIEYLKEIGGSALTDKNIEIPTKKATQSEGSNLQSKIPPTYVPFRNAHLLSIATSWAEVIGAHKIFIGAAEEDSSGYPDCRAVFYEAFQRAINEGTKPETSVEISTPLIDMKKSDIVKKGLKLNAPFRLTWSCYKSLDLACGECESCLLRLNGFREAGDTDPLPYKL